MGEKSHISWTDNTFNYWIGCTKVSVGCDNCYAEREQDLRYGRARWGKGNARYLTSESNRKTPFKWEREAARSPWTCPRCTLPSVGHTEPGPCHACGTECVPNRPRVFTASLSDVFDEEVPDAWRDSLFDIIRKTPHLDWLVLTKRLAKMLRYVRGLAYRGAANVPGNAWWGCSIEDQPTANLRVPELLKLRQWVGDAPLWLSVEPLIGPIDLNALEPNRLETFNALTGEGEVRDGSDTESTGGAHVDWVVVGGESGPAARPMHPDWPRLLRDQCVAAGVPFHFKQWGEWAPAPDVGCECESEDHECGGENSSLSKREDRSGNHRVIDMNGLDSTGWNGPGQVTPFAHMVRVGKKAAGRLLDGVEWNEFRTAKRGDEFKEG